MQLIKISLSESNEYILNSKKEQLVLYAKFLKDQYVQQGIDVQIFMEYRFEQLRPKSIFITENLYFYDLEKEFKEVDRVQITDVDNTKRRFENSNINYLNRVLNLENTLLPEEIDYLYLLSLLSLQSNQSIISILEKNKNIIFNGFINLGYRLALLASKYNLSFGNIKHNLNIKNDREVFRNISDLFSIFSLEINKLNKDLVENKPWSIYKTDPQGAKNILEKLIIKFFNLLSFSEIFLPRITDVFKDFYNTNTNQMNKFENFDRVQSLLQNEVNKEATHILKKTYLKGIPLWRENGIKEFVSYYEIIKDIFTKLSINSSIYLSSNFLDRKKYDEMFGKMFAGKQIPFNKSLYWASESNLQTFPYLLQENKYDEVFLSLVQRFRQETINPDDFWRQRNIFPCLGMNMISKKSPNELRILFKEVYQCFFYAINVPVRFFKFGKGDYGSGHLICSAINEVQWTGIGMIYILGDTFKEIAKETSMVNSGFTGKLISYKKSYYDIPDTNFVFKDKTYIDSSLVYIDENCAQNNGLNIIARSEDHDLDKCVYCGKDTLPLLISKSANFY